MDNINLQSLVTVIEKRCLKRNLKADLERIRYSNECLYQDISTSGKILYVGLGHGLDALLALIDDLAIEITGIDPYIDEHGNDQQDYDELIKLTRQYNIENKYLIKKTTIQEFLNNTRDKYDAVICSDVLHHIFWTSELLQESDLSSSAVELFKSLLNASGKNGLLIISEPERHGLRQMLTKNGVLKGCVNYSTKQPRNEWIKAAENGGWKLIHSTNYVPWALRAYSPLLSGIVGRYTACDKYILTFSQSNIQ